MKCQGQHHYLQCYLLVLHQLELANLFASIGKSRRLAYNRLSIHHTMNIALANEFMINLPRLVNFPQNNRHTATEKNAYHVSRFDILRAQAKKGFLPWLAFSLEKPPSPNNLLNSLQERNHHTRRLLRLSFLLQILDVKVALSVRVFQALKASTSIPRGRRGTIRASISD